MADSTQILTSLGDGYVRKNDKGELVLLAFQVDKDGQDVPVGSAADPLYVLFADGVEVSIENGTFNYDIRKVGQANVKHVGADQVLASDYAVATSAVPYYLDGAGNAKAVVMDELGDIDGFDTTDRLAQTNNSVMYGRYNDTDYILPIGTDVQGSDAGIGNYAALFTNDALVGIGSDTIANQGFAPGWMPSALGSGAGTPIDSASPGDSFIAGSGLIVTSATYDGFGNPIYGVQGTTYAIPVNNVLLGTAAVAYGQNYDTGDGEPINQAYPGAFLVNAPDGYNGLVTVTSLDAVGGVPVSPAVDISNAPNILSMGLTTPIESSVLSAYVFDTFDGIYGLSTTGAEDTFGGYHQALDTALTFWGRQGVSDAQELGVFFLDPTNFRGPVGASQMLAYGYGDSKLLQIDATYDGDGGSYANDIALDTAMTFWGRQGLSDALTVYDAFANNLFTDNLTIIPTISQVAGYVSGSDLSYPITLTGYNDSYALDSAVKIWGGAGVSDAVDAATAVITAAGTKSPVVINLNYVSNGAGGWVPMLQPAVV